MTSPGAYQDNVTALPSRPPRAVFITSDPLLAEHVRALDPRVPVSDMRRLPGSNPPLIPPPTGCSCSPVQPTRAGQPAPASPPSVAPSTSPPTSTTPPSGGDPPACAPTPSCSYPTTTTSSRPRSTTSSDPLPLPR